jgi:response regulator RpfG family c-di-GMP phosphodiesterase
MNDILEKTSDARTRQLTAMCIDDETVDLMLSERALRRSGAFARILKFPVAEDALAHLRAHPEERVDVIFLDVNMPRMNGFEFLEAATGEFGPDFARHVVIMLTTSLHHADVDRAKSLRVIRDYLSKPLSVEEAVRLAELVRSSS